MCSAVDGLHYVQGGFLSDDWNMQPKVQHLSPTVVSSTNPAPACRIFPVLLCTATTVSLCIWNVYALKGSHATVEPSQMQLISITRADAPFTG